MKTLRVLLGTFLMTTMVFGTALAEETEEAGDETADDSGDETAAPDAEPAPEPAPEPEPEPEPEPAPAPAAEEPAAEEAPAEEAAPAAPSVSFTVDARERARFWIVPTNEGEWSIDNLAHLGVSASMGGAFGRVEIRGTHSFGDAADAPKFALQQAYAGFSMDNGLTLAAGRMEATWHNGRLVSEIDWTDAGNAFDAVTLIFSKPKVEAQVAYIKQNGVSADHHTIALRGGPRLGDALMLDAVAIIVVDKDADTTLATVGAYAEGNKGIFAYEVDVYGQFSKAGDVSAPPGFTLGVRAGVNPEHAIKPYIGGGVDVVTAGFNHLLGDSFGFYGHLQQTRENVDALAGGGLIDGIVRIGLSPYESLRLNVDAHFFLNPWADDAFQAFEADIEATWMCFDSMALTAGAWINVPSGEGATPTVAMLVQSDWKF